MTEQRSDHKGRYFIFQLWKMRACIIISSIFAVCGYPVLLFWNNTGYRDRITDPIIISISVLGIMGTVIMSFVCPLIAMKHLYTRTTADNILSLPVTARQRYFCDTAVSLLSYAGPYIIANVPAFLIVSFLPHSEGVSQGSIQISVLMLLCLLMFSMMNIFLICLCGRLTEAILYPVAINVILPIFTYFALRLARANVYGLGDYYNSFSSSLRAIFGWTSPIGCFLYYEMLCRNNWFEAAIPALIFVLLFFVLGYIVYIRRPAHNIGQPFVFGKAYPINTTIISVMGMVAYIASLVERSSSTHGFFSGENAIPCFIMAALLLALLLAMEFVSYRKIKSLPKFLLKYIGILAGGALISFGLYSSEGFGETYIVPTADETAYIEVTADLFGHDLYSGYNITSTVNLTIDGDSEMSEYIRDIHRSAIKERHTDENGDGTLKILYTLKNGNHIDRRYLFCDIPADFTEKIVNSPEYRISCITSIERAHYEYEAEQRGELETVIYSMYRDYPNTVTALDPITRETYFLGHVDYTALREALKTDLMNDSSFGRHNDPVLCALRLGFMCDRNSYTGREEFITYTDDLVIYENYTETIAFLKQLGNIPTADEVIRKFADRDSLISVTRWRTVGNNQTVLAVTPYIAMTYSGTGIAAAQTVFLTTSEFSDIISNNASYVVPDGQEYTYMMTMGIPDSFRRYMDDQSPIENHIAEQIINSGDVNRPGFHFNDEGLLLYTELPNWRITLNERCYGELEKFFDDGRPVYTHNSELDAEEPEAILPARVPTDTYVVTTAVQVS